MVNNRTTIIALTMLSLAFTTASAREIKVGIVTASSGPFASFGAEFKRGIELFQEERGTKIGDHTVTVIYRDSGTKPDVAKRLTEELILQDRADIIGGIAFTPEALAIAPVLTEAQVPGVIFNAGTNFLTRKSPMLVRASFTLDQSMVPMVDWAAKEGGIRTAVICVADYAPGQTAAATYEEELKRNGIKVLDIIKMPFDTKDFSVFVQRIKDAKPDGVFIFLPNGPPSISFMKTIGERGLMKDGVKVFGTAEFTDTDLAKFDDNILGAYSAWWYSPSHESEKNKAFVAAFSKKYPGIVPDHSVVAAYDGMNVIYEMIRKSNGKMGPAAVEAVKGLTFESPRGPMSIDAKERDVVQNIYLRRVTKKDGAKLNEEFKTYPNVKDPWKQRNPE